MIIKILGPGCNNCKKLEANTKKAIENLNIDAKIEKVTDFKEMMKYGVMQTPSLVIDDEVKIVGKVSSEEEIKKLIVK